MTTLLNNSFKFLGKHSIVVVFLLYTGYLGHTFICPEFFTDPIIQDDYALHYANSIETVEHLKCRGVPWGYSPQYCGGRLSFGINEFWFAAFIFLLAPLLGTALSFNISIIAAFLVPPIIMVLTLKCFGCKHDKIMWGITFIMLGVIGMVPLRSFYYTGCFGFVIGTSFSFLLLGVLKRYVDYQSLKSLLALSIGGAIAIVIHPLSAVIFPCLAFPFVIVRLKEMKIKTVTFLLCAGCFSIGLNLTWLVPHFQYLKVLEKGAVTGMQTHPLFFLDVLTQNKAFTVYLILFTIQLYRLFVIKMLKDALSWSISAILLSSIAFWGTQIGLNYIEPNRFIIPLLFLMIIVVSSHLKLGFSRKKIPESLLAISFILLIVKPIPSYTFGFSMFPAVKEIVSALQKTKYDQGRILFQDAYDHPWFDCHFSALIPILTGRETTANSFRLCPPRYAQFIENMLFETTLDKITEQELKENLHLFNISHILTYNEDARRFFNSSRLVSKERYIENFSIYNVNDFDDNLCFNCSAKITAKTTNLQVYNATDSVTTLKYHYFKILTTEPVPLVITPVILLNDPIPFIQIKNGTTHNFTIICK